MVVEVAGTEPAGSSLHVAVDGEREDAAPVAEVAGVEAAGSCELVVQRLVAAGRGRHLFSKCCNLIRGDSSRVTLLVKCSIVCGLACLAMLLCGLFYELFDF